MSKLKIEVSAQPSKPSRIIGWAIGMVITYGVPIGVSAIVGIPLLTAIVVWAVVIFVLATLNIIWEGDSEG